MALSDNFSLTACTVLALAIIAGYYTYNYADETPQHFRMNDILAAMLKVGCV